MAKKRENSATILPGLKRYEAEKVIEEKKWIIVEVKTHLNKPACPY
jgi:hypothetical protein